MQSIGGGVANNTTTICVRTWTTKCGAIATILQAAEAVFTRINDVEEAIFVLEAIVDLAHQCSRRRQNTIADKEKNGLLGAQLHVLSNLVHEFPDSDVRWNKVFFLVNIGHVALGCLLDNHLL
jgi:hypothetical protein